MLKQQILRLTNSLLGPFGAEIVKDKSASGIIYQKGIDPSSSYMKDESHRKIVISKLSDIAKNFFFKQLTAAGNR